jgi:MFS family permease
VRLLAILGELSPAARFLAISQLAINVGFYMLLPYLASYLANDLSIAAWAVGLVMGVRTFSQQGLYFVGGTVCDRLGFKTAIVSGYALRVIGFGLFVFVDSLPWLMLAALGLAGAAVMTVLDRSGVLAAVPAAQKG